MKAYVFPAKVPNLWEWAKISMSSQLRQKNCLNEGMRFLAFASQMPCLAALMNN